MREYDDYESLAALRVRAHTHHKYSDKPDDISATIANRLPAPGELRRVLDVGCGTGAFLGYLSTRRHYSVLIGVDTSSEAAKAADSINGSYGIQASAEGLPFSDGSFDLLTASHMLYHVPNPALAVAEFRRVLTTGGHIVITVNAEDYLPHLTQLVREVCGVAEQRPWVYPADVRRLLKSAGFKQHTEQCVNNSLKFEEADPLIQYCQSILGIYGVPPHSSRRSEAERTVRQRVYEWFDQNSSPWVDPKSFSIIAAMKG